MSPESPVCVSSDNEIMRTEIAGFEIQRTEIMRTGRRDWDRRGGGRGRVGTWRERSAPSGAARARGWAETPTTPPTGEAGSLKVPFLLV